MKTIIPLLLLLLLPLAGTRAQTSRPVTPGEQQRVLEKIASAARQARTITCDFVQTKTLSILDETITSRGLMLYRQDNRLRWEYHAPYHSIFILDDRKILMQAGEDRNVIDVESSKLFREIVKIMMNSVSGNGLTDARSFTARYHRDSDSTWRITLIPVQREIRKMFSVIELTFNTGNYSVDKVRMEESNGDETIIELSAKQFNATLEDEIFTID